MPRMYLAAKEYIEIYLLIFNQKEYKNLKK